MRKKPPQPERRLRRSREARNLKIMRAVVRSALELAEKNPELGLTVEGIKDMVRKENPEWLEDKPQ